jgi:uncharacterized protein YjbI with pentapeptide repeats
MTNDLQSLTAHEFRQIVAFFSDDDSTDPEKRSYNDPPLAGIRLVREIPPGEKPWEVWADLSGLDLSGIPEQYRDLSGSVFEYINFARTNFSGSLMRRVEMAGCRLAGANLGGVKLDSANLKGADLDGADLYGADLYGF